MRHRFTYEKGTPLRDALFSYLFIFHRTGLFHVMPLPASATLAFSKSYPAGLPPHWPYTSKIMSPYEGIGHISLSTSISSLSTGLRNASIAVTTRSR